MPLRDGAALPGLALFPAQQPPICHRKPQSDDAETAARRLVRWWLTGSKAGQHEPMADLPGYPDNLGRGAGGMVWVAMPTRHNPMLERMRAAHWPLRWLAARLPQALQPKPEPIALVLGVGADGQSCTT